MPEPVRKGWPGRWRITYRWMSWRSSTTAHGKGVPSLCFTVRWADRQLRCWARTIVGFFHSSKIALLRLGLLKHNILPHRLKIPAHHSNISTDWFFNILWFEHYFDMLSVASCPDSPDWSKKWFAAYSGLKIIPMSDSCKSSGWCFIIDMTSIDGTPVKYVAQFWIENYSMCDSWKLGDGWVMLSVTLFLHRLLIKIKF